MNVHLHHLVDEEIIRVYQMRLALKWLENNSLPNDFNIIVGDFNCQPGSQTYELVNQQGYKSAYVLKHGREPMKTFHNKMDCDTKDDDEEGTFDYIL
jgi:endonuclease/exonuclease/phosphatase family metal-dependent hydrolase